MSDIEGVRADLAKRVSARMEGVRRDVQRSTLRGKPTEAEVLAAAEFATLPSVPLLAVHALLADHSRLLERVKELEEALKHIAQDYTAPFDGVDAVEMNSAALKAITPRAANTQASASGKAEEEAR